MGCEEARWKELEGWSEIHKQRDRERERGEGENSLRGIKKGNPNHLLLISFTTSLLASFSELKSGLKAQRAVTTVTE